MPSRLGSNAIVLGGKRPGLLPICRRGSKSLTPRERQIMALVVTGEQNKQIAHRAGLSENIVKVHRSHIMQKMRAKSVAELVRPRRV